MTEFSFGYEAEFENNVEALATRLHHDGLMAEPSLHGYHCRCDNCSFESDWAYRAQHDSSCGGEVISGVCRDMDEGREWMEALQAAAVDADAEPSTRAGFHVHVGVREMARASLFHEDILWNYLRWEPVFGELARGRFVTVRGFNTEMRTEMALFTDFDPGYVNHYLSEEDLDLVLGVRVPWRGRRGDGRPMDPSFFDDWDAEPKQVIKRLYAHYAMNNADRHSWLSMQTRDNRTVEFRLWNSTRSAWRMEMAVRTSLLFVNPEAHNALAEAVPSLDRLLSIGDTFDPGLGELMERQTNSPGLSTPMTVLAA